MHLQLCIPGLIWPHFASTHQKPQGAMTPSLDAMLRFGKTERTAISMTDLQGNLRRQDSLLSTAKAELQLPQDCHAFLVSPCLQKLEMNSVNLLAGQSLQLQAEEAEALCQSLSDFLPDLGWQFYPWQPELWVVTCPNEPQWVAPIVTEMLGQMDRHTRPEGEEARLMMRTQAEIQMFLATHPVNQARKAQQMDINGVWFWRDLPVKHDAWQQKPFGILASDSLLLQDNHPFTQAKPYDYTAWLRLYQELPEAKDLLAIIDLNDLLMPTAFADIWGYQDHLQQLETRFFAPIWAALKAGQIQTLTIVSNGDAGLVTTVKAKAHRAFWKSKKTFSQIQP